MIQFEVTEKVRETCLTKQGQVITISNPVFASKMSEPTREPRGALSRKIFKFEVSDSRGGGNIDTKMARNYRWTDQNET